MRRLNLKAKDHVVMELPDELVSFLMDVNDLIDAGDESAILPSDDLLQCKCAYGGLTEEGGSQFWFSYFLEENIRVKWELSLNKEEINQIAHNKLNTIPLWQCKDRLAGVRLLTQRSLVSIAIGKISKTKAN